MKTDVITFRGQGPLHFRQWTEDRAETTKYIRLRKMFTDNMGRTFERVETFIRFPFDNPVCNWATRIRYTESWRLKDGRLYECDEYGTLVRVLR